MSLEEKYAYLYTEQDPFFMEAGEALHSSPIPLPSAKVWLEQKIKFFQPIMFTKDDNLYYRFRKQEELHSQTKEFPIPTKEYWEQFYKEKKTTGLLTQGIDDEFDVFYSKYGLKMLARFGATRKELIENFGELGKEAADEVGLFDYSKQSTLVDIDRPSIFDITVDPDQDIQQTRRSNPTYPPIRKDRFVPHHQEPKITTVPPCEIDLEKYELKIEYGEKYCDNGKSRVCSPAMIEDIFNLKDEFSNFDENAFNKARTKANPYETIGKSIFYNRAAVKMANLDFIFNFTNSDEFGHPPYVEPLSKKDEYFYFSDICAGPGGFTDYLYWRLNGRAHGVGMTLGGNTNRDHDWYPDNNFLTGIPTFYKEYGEEGNGSVFNPANIAVLKERIAERSHGKMAELLTADGGVAADAEENAQECIHKRLVLCQFLCALEVLRKGGNFLCKVFDLYTDFSVELVYLLAQSFEKFCIIKPYTSRPANSERYIVGLGLREQNPASAILLSKLNDSKIWEDPNKEITSFFDFDLIPEDFLKYLTESNEELVQKQEEACTELLTYGYNPDLAPLDQEDVKKRCLEEWKLPPIKPNIKELRMRVQSWRPAPVFSDVVQKFPLQVKQEGKKYTQLPSLQLYSSKQQQVQIPRKMQKYADVIVSPFGYKIDQMLREKTNEDEDPPAVAIAYTKYFPKHSDSTFYFD